MLDAPQGGAVNFFLKFLTMKLPMLPKNSARVLSLLFVLVPLLFISGCGKKVPLRGTVVFSDDGSSITSGTIFFTDGKNAARGTIQPDGTFVMGSNELDDGLPPGDYTVYFYDVTESAPASVPVSASPFGGPASTGPPPMGGGKPLVHPKYTSAQTSDLKVTVNSSTKTMEFKLERNPNL